MNGFEVCVPGGFPARCLCFRRSCGGRQADRRGCLSVWCAEATVSTSPPRHAQASRFTKCSRCTEREQTLLKCNNAVFSQRSCTKLRAALSDVKVHVVYGEHWCTCPVPLCGRVIGSIHILSGSLTFLSEWKSVAILRRESFWQVDNAYNVACEILKAWYH